MMQYTVMIEKAASNYSAYVPDLRLYFHGRNNRGNETKPSGSYRASSGGYAR